MINFKVKLWKLSREHKESAAAEFLRHARKKFIHLYMLFNIMLYGQTKWKSAQNQPAVHPIATSS